MNFIGGCFSPVNKKKITGARSARKKWYVYVNCVESSGLGGGFEGSEVVTSTPEGAKTPAARKKRCSIWLIDLLGELAGERKHVLVNHVLRDRLPHRDGGLLELRVARGHLLGDQRPSRPKGSQLGSNRANKRASEPGS